MRNLVLALVILNLGFFAYAAWIDQPERSAGDGTPALPKLLLASEFAQAASGSAAAPAVASQPARVSSSASGAPSNVASNTGAQVATPAGTLAGTAAGTSGGAPGATSAGTAAGGAIPGGPANLGSCVAVGPFNDPAGAAKASSVLQDLGLAPRERRAPGEVTDGFWVHVENITNANDQSRVMRELQQAGLNDASPIQSADQSRHISVGIFSERARAERRAKSVQRLGIDAQVSARTHPGTVYWLEMEPKGSQPSVPIEGISQTEGAPLEVRACNSVQAGAPTARR